MDINVDNKSDSTIHYILRGEIPSNSMPGKITRLLLGKEYSYGVKYSYGTIGLLTTMKGVKLFNKFKLPMVHMIFAYSSAKEGGAIVTPIFVTKRRKNILGLVLSRILLIFAVLGFKFLQGEDGKIYENIRFNTSSFLKIDRPVAQFIHYIDGLKPSAWGLSWLKPVEEAPLRKLTPELRVDFDSL